MDLSKFSTFIFDVNGVLIDSNCANAQAMARAFTDDRTLQQQIRERYLKLTGIDRGSKIRILQREFMKDPLTKGDFERLWERVKTLTRISMVNAPLLPGCKEVLATLGRLGIRRVALSNTPAGELEEILHFHALESYLDHIRGGGDWPKSESLERLFREFGWDPYHSVLVGDGRGDLLAARHAGVTFIAIDPGLGEFEGERGFEGPYHNLAHWAQEVLGERFEPEATSCS